MKSDNIPLINLMLRELTERLGIGYAEAIEQLYASKLFSLMQDSSNNTYNTWAAADLIDEMFRIESVEASEPGANHLHAELSFY